MSKSMTTAFLQKLAEKASPTGRANIQAALAGPVASVPADERFLVPIAQKSKAAIRMPSNDRDIPNKTEQRFHDHFTRLWKPAFALYERVSLRLPSGTRYTLDWLFEWTDGVRLHVECKAAHIHNQRSAHAFKEASAAFNFERWKFLFAQWKGGQWHLTGDRPCHICRLWSKSDSCPHCPPQT